MHIQVQVGLGHVHCFYCGARKECIVICVVHRSFDEMFDGQQVHLGFVTVTDTQQVALQGVQLRNSLWTTLEVERRQLPLLLFFLIGSAGAITASTISSSV